MVLGSVIVNLLNNTKQTEHEAAQDDTLSGPKPNYRWRYTKLIFKSKHR